MLENNGFYDFEDSPVTFVKSSLVTRKFSLEVTLTILAVF